LNILDYQKWTDTTAIYPTESELEAINYVILGLVGEAGEVANKFKKVIRDSGGIIENDQRKKIIDEASDVLWYLTRLCSELGYDLEDLADYNYQKLEDRRDRNSLSGSGDSR